MISHGLAVIFILFAFGIGAFTGRYVLGRR